MQTRRIQSSKQQNGHLLIVNQYKWSRVSLCANEQRIYNILEASFLLSTFQEECVHWRCVPLFTVGHTTKRDAQFVCHISLSDRHDSLWPLCCVGRRMQRALGKLRAEDVTKHNNMNTQAMLWLISAEFVWCCLASQSVRFVAGELLLLLQWEMLLLLLFSCWRDFAHSRLSCNFYLLEITAFQNAKYRNKRAIHKHILFNCLKTSRFSFHSSNVYLQVINALYYNIRMYSIWRSFLFARFLLLL